MNKKKFNETTKIINIVSYFGFMSGWSATN